MLKGVSRTYDIDDFDEDFASDVASPSYDAAYTFIEPSYDPFDDYEGGNSQHPLGSIKAGELLIKKTYEALRSSPIWESSLLIVTYDEEHHRIAFINIPELKSPPQGVFGLHHVAFTFSSLRDLLNNFAHLKERGVEPAWSVNHGPTTSLYYVDPDGNQLEFQVDNYENIEDATEFMFSDDFDVNPIGVDFDPEQLRQKLLAGDAEDALKLRPASGPRGVDGIPIS